MTRVVKSAIALLAVSAAARPSDVVRRDDDLDCSPESGNINNPDCPLFTWGSIGDSYSSGVAYNEDVEFDGNRDGCLRINQAYSALMIQDTSWTVGQQAPVFNGCSGSRLVDMHGNGNTGRQLINRLSPLSTVVLMQAGGNDCSFADIASNCIYQQTLNHHYGPEYADDPDCTGECCKAIDRAQQHIDNLGEHGLTFDLVATLDDLIDTTDQFAGDNEQWLYVILYAHFFNDQTSGPGTCDEWTFGAFPADEYVGGHSPKVTQPLRARMNSLMTDFNQRYMDAINAYKAKRAYKHVGFISTTEKYDGHRFCEAGKTLGNQYSSADTWFWNFSFNNGEVDVFYNESGVTIDDATSESMEVSFDADGDLSVYSGGSKGGSALRPFHPKPGGHGAIKDAILARMRSDVVPGVTATDPVACGLSNYADATNGPIRDGIDYLKKQTIYTNYGYQGFLISCSYGTGIWLSVDAGAGDGQVIFPGTQIADDVQVAYNHCRQGNKNGDSDTIQAFQYWAKGYNVLVTGGQGC